MFNINNAYIRVNEVSLRKLTNISIASFPWEIINSFRTWAHGKHL